MPFTTNFSELPADKKVFLASDFHLGMPDFASSLAREQKIVRWLDSIVDRAAAIILVGDLFDFWFEYKKVIPRGFVRLQGKLAQLSDTGLPIVFFAGNHDLWMRDYFTSELGIPVFHSPTTFQIGPHRVLIGHGDGLGPGDQFFKSVKRVFTNQVAQWAFRWLHPDVGIGLANKWSAHSRTKEEEVFKGEQEYLYQFCLQTEATNPHDYYIFGHRHLPLEMAVGAKATYINLGEWLSQCHYAEIGIEKAELKKFEG